MTPEEQRAVGARIAAARRAAGVTQRELASELGVTVRSIQNYEAGVVIPYRHLLRIESMTRRRPGWLLHGGQESDLAKTVGALQDSLVEHQKLLESHLEVLRRQTELLRETREANEDRRGEPSGSR